MTALAVLADIHGNRWALEAVLDELGRTPLDGILNLGDTLWGPLDPAGTADLLRQQPIRHVRGNTDREMLEASHRAPSPTDLYSLAALSPARRLWLAAHDPVIRLDDILACHGTPASDSLPLLEEIAPGTIRRRTAREVETTLGRLDPSIRLILCGHTHLPGAVQVPNGPLVVNPGSIGLPAYSHNVPFPHCVENGTPHAQYAVIHRGRGGWRVEQRRVAYDWEAAAACAAEVGRADWDYHLRTGRVAASSPPALTESPASPRTRKSCRYWHRTPGR